MTQIDDLPTDERERILRPLLDHLARGHDPTARGHDPTARGERLASHEWQGWQIRRIDGGWCNLLYRATRTSGPATDLACKFTMRDERDRAGREYNALRALDEAGLDIAPQPLLLDRDSYPQPVVAQTWLSNETSEAPPATDAGWEGLLRHLVLAHSVTPERTGMRLQRAVLDARSAAEARETVRWQVSRIAPEARPASLHSLLRRFEAAGYPEWPKAPVTLCRCDNNVRNYLRRPGAWASVDWEYSGWGDPAFDVAQWATHASYTDVPAARWEWALDAYCRLADERGASDPALALRIRVYLQIMAVWWVARTARYLYEIPAGLDRRLVPWPEDWEDGMRLKYEHYSRLAERCLS